MTVLMAYNSISRWSGALGVCAIVAIIRPAHADPRAVVDPELRVHGIAGLRIADASIMPTLTSGNTNAPAIMIGEKCASMVLAAAEVARAA